MSGFGDEKELVHDLSIAATIPGTGGQGFATGAVGAYALKKLYHVLFDDKTSTWRDGRGNIVPPPSELGQLNFPYTRGSVVETGSAAVRPYYDPKRRKWTDTSKGLPDLNSDDSNVVEAHLGKTLAQFQVGMASEYKHHFTKDELAFIRKHYESAARGKKPIPVKSDSDAITKYKTFMDYIRDKAPDGMFGRGVRGRVSAELHSRRAAGAESASEADAHENFSRIESRRRAGVIADRQVRSGDAPSRAKGVSPAHAPFMPSVDANILAPADESFERPVNRAREDPVHLQFHGDDVPGVSVEEAFKHIPANRRSALGIWHVGHGRYYSDSEWKDVTEIARELAAYEGSHSSSSSAAAALPALPRALSEADVGPPPPGDDPVELVDNREPDRREESIYRPHEVEVNDAPGAPYQGPGYFDIDPPKDVGVVPLGREYQPPFALLHEEQVEMNRKRRYETCVIVPYKPALSAYGIVYGFWKYYGAAPDPVWVPERHYLPTSQLLALDGESFATHSFSFLWSGSSARALRPGPFEVIPGSSPSVAFGPRYGSPPPPRPAFGYHVDSGIDPSEREVANAFAEACLTYVPPGLGVSERLGLKVSGNYLQARIQLSPAWYIPARLQAAGKIVSEAVPFSNVPAEYTSSGWMSSCSQALTTIHRVIFVLTANPLVTFSDVVVDGGDIHSPISLHIRGAHEILKDTMVDSDRTVSLSCNLQLKGRPFYFTPVAPTYQRVKVAGVTVSASTLADVEEIGLIRGYHIVCLYAAAVISIPIDLLKSGQDWRHRLDSVSLSPRCHLSYAFSFSDV